MAHLTVEDLLTTPRVLTYVNVVRLRADLALSEAPALTEAQLAHVATCETCRRGQAAIETLARLTAQLARKVPPSRLRASSCRSAFPGTAYVVDDRTLEAAYRRAGGVA